VRQCFVVACKLYAGNILRSAWEYCASRFRSQKPRVAVVSKKTRGLFKLQQVARLVKDQAKS